MNPKRIRFLIGLVSNSENFVNSTQIRLSVNRSVDRPKSRSTVPNRELGHVSQSTGRSTVSFCDRPGGRPRWPVHVGAHRSTARSTGVCYCCFFTLASSLSTSSLSLPTILHLGEDFKSKPNFKHRICRLESGCTSVVAYVPYPRDQAIRSSSKGASTSSCNMKDMEQCFTMCKLDS